MTHDPLFDIEEGFDAGEWNNVVLCPVCNGSGFSGRGTGYDDVCGECGGLKYFPSKSDATESAPPADPLLNGDGLAEARGEK